MASHEQTMLDSLAKTKIITETSLDRLVAFLGSSAHNTVITFTDKVILPDEPMHNKLLYITIKYQGYHVPFCWVDIESNLNVCAFLIAITLGMAMLDITHSA